MSEKLREKAIQLSQRSALKAVAVALGGDLMVVDQMLHPASGQIAGELRTRLAAKGNGYATHVTLRVTRSLDELDELFSEFVSSVRDRRDLLCVLPGVTVIDDRLVTALPVLMTDALGVERMYSHFSRSNSFDFFGAISEDRKTFIVISSYADFPSDANQFFDGIVYEALFGT